jgi:hypothetical protein
MDRPFYRAMQESQFLTSLTRATRALCYKGDAGFQRYVGWCVITKNLFSVARHRQRRRDHAESN